MPRPPFPRLCVALFAALAFGGSVRAQDYPAQPPAPHARADGSRTLEFIRRTYDRPPRAEAPGRVPASLSGGTPPLELSSDPLPSAKALPLQLAPDVWTQTVLPGGPRSQPLLQNVLRSRGPALLYYGLFSLDDETRAWIATRRPLLADLSARHAAAFVVAAPGLRVRGTALQPPGGDAARAAWESLVGRRLEDAEGFTRALLERDGGRLAFFFGTLAQLTPAQLDVALQLNAPEPVRVDAARRLMAVFDRVLLRWTADDHVFWRPPLDPAVLLSSLRTDAQGRPVVRGDQRFWTRVLRGSGHAFDDEKSGPATASSDRPSVDFAWLAGQVFTGDRSADRERHELVLFVSRLAALDGQWASSQAAGTVRAARQYPALMLSLERANLTNLAAFEAAARRAERIARIDDDTVHNRTVAQFQGAVALVLRAARGSADRDRLAAAMTSLAAVELSDRGEYEGRLVAWLASWLEEHLRNTRLSRSLDLPAMGSVDADAIAALAGPVDPVARIVEWEGTRYRLDLASAEAHRLLRHIGSDPRPYLSSARTLVGVAATLSGEITVDTATRGLAAVEELARALGWHDANTDHAPRELKEVRSGLVRAAKGQDLDRLRRLVPRALRLADDLLARGLTELAYAAALGHPERTTISAGEAAARHKFSSLTFAARSSAWRLPTTGAIPGTPWHITGALLGLDVSLAELRLVRLSERPPARKPALASDHRRILVEAVALADGWSLSDNDRGAIVSAIRRGRERLSAARTLDDAAALADKARLSPLRRTMLAWTIMADRPNLSAFLSLTELLWLGLDDRPILPEWHAWGAPASPRTGCLCLELMDRQPWETLTGRLQSGLVASTLPDLNLRLAELLEELQLPSALLASILGPATLDLVENAAASDPDDRQPLLDFIRELRRERVADYLALLTADGPLVPLESGVDR